MSQFSIPLQPVASPTNQFTAPRISAPSNQNASDLSQLSQALAQITPELAHVFSSRFQADVEGSQARANQDFQQKRYANTKALKAAVDAGQIDEADNPWYMVQLRQDVAANDASDAVRQMQTDWESSPVRFSDDPKDVENWGREQLGLVTDGRDAYESEAMAPILQDGMNQMLGRHMEVRRQERAEERVANFQQRVGDILQGSDPKANADQLNSLITEARLTMPGSQVNALVLKAAGDTAEASGDEGVLSALSMVPNAGAGGTLADAPEVKQLQQQLPLMRLRRSQQIDEYLEHQQKAQQEQSKKAMLDGLMKASGYHPENIRITPELAAKWGVPFEDTIDLNEKAIRYGDLQDEQGDKVATRVDKANTRLASQLSGTTEAGIASGKIKLTDPEVADTRARIATLSPANLGQFDMFLRDTYEMNGRQAPVYARESDPNTYNDLWTKAKAGSLTPGDLIPQAGKLSHEDWTRLYQETVKTDTGGTKVSDFPMGKYDELLKDMIVWPKTFDFEGGSRRHETGRAGPGRTGTHLAGSDADGRDGADASERPILHQAPPRPADGPHPSSARRHGPGIWRRDRPAASEIR